MSTKFEVHVVNCGIDTFKVTTLSTEINITWNAALTFYLI